MGNAGAASSSLEASGAQIEPGAVEVERILDAVPADERRAQVRREVAVDVQEPDPEHPQHPLVRARGHGMDAARLDVDGKRAGLLDGVHHEQHVAVPAELPDGVHVGAVAARELHRAHRHQAGPRTDGLVDRLRSHRAVRHPDLAQRHASVRQVLPGVDVGRVLQGARHRHLVAGSPVETLRHRGETVRRALHERDLARRRADELGGPRPDPGGAFPPRARPHVALRHVVVEPGVDGRPHARRARRHRRTVEIGTLLAGRKRAAVLLAEGRHGASLHDMSTDPHCRGKRPRMGKRPLAHASRRARRASASRWAM